jgi:hypothetical protein
MNKEKLNTLINQSHTLIKHQKEKEILKGEKFNVFSILKMESKENDTHSAFLCELLNPKGSHLKGNLFLRLFLETIDNDSMDLASCQVKVEYSVGSRNDTDKTGGRIDIYIKDNFNNSLSIENKIYAVDQNVQIERYCNHNKEKNNVYYLTLEGNEASKASCGELKAGEDYYTLSYKEDISNWLQLCMKESVENPILRETIKQYILLINKLTHTMNKDEEKELFNLILQNSEEAAVIANNYKNAVWNLSREIRTGVFKKLESKLGTKYKVLLGNNVDKAYSQIWIKLVGKEETKLFFGIESFSIPKQNFTDSINIGIFVKDGYKLEYKVLGEKFSNWWVNVEGIPDYKDKDEEVYVTNTRDAKTLKHLNSNSKESFIDHIVDFSEKYIESNYDKVAQLLADI